MKKFYSLLACLLFSTLSYSQSVILYEGFDDASQYSVSMPETIVNQTAYFTRTDGTNITNNLAWGSGDFNYFTAQDIDTAPMTSPASMTFSSISISGKSNILFGMSLGESDALDGMEDWDNDDYLHVEYQIDGGSWVNLIWIESSGAGESAPQVDTNFNGDGDGAIITNDFEDDVQASIPNAGGTGSSLNIRLTFGGLTEPDEDIAIEQLYIVNNLNLFPDAEIISPDWDTTFIPGTSSVDVHFTTTNSSNILRIDALVNDVLTSNISSPLNVPTTNGSEYTVEILVYMNGFTDFPISDNDTYFTIAPLTQVTNIDGLRADVDAIGDLRYFEISGECTVTHTDAVNGRQWIQDPITKTGLLIYEDGTGLDIPFYTVGQNVSGLKGMAKIDTNNNGLLIFVPFENSGTVQSSGNTITPQTIQIDAFLVGVSSRTFESELIKFENVTFNDGNGSDQFTSNSTYLIQDDTFAQVEVFTTFSAANYINQTIPSLVNELVAIGGQNFGSGQIYIRNLSDITLDSKEFSLNNLKLYPNPTDLGHVNISSRSNSKMNVSVFDILGKQLLNSVIRNNYFDVSSLNSGVYILKVNQDEATSTRKLVVK